MKREARSEKRDEQTLPASVRGATRLGAGNIGVREYRGTSPAALISQLLRLSENEVLTLKLETPEECKSLGLAIDARRQDARGKHQVDIRVGMDGPVLRLWKDAWDGEGPIGEEE